MALPIDRPYPIIANPVTMRAAAILPAAGAWDAAPTEVACAGAEWMRFFFTYTRGAATGAFEYYYDGSPYAVDVAGVEDWFHGSLYVPGTLILCNDVMSLVQREYINYCATSANAETFIGPPIHLAGCVERLRIFCREAGVIGNPGTVHVVAAFYAGG